LSNDVDKRLARNGTTLFILSPIAEPRKVDEAVRCECDGMPNVRPGDALVLVVDDAPTDKVLTVRAPFTYDFVDWECKTTLL
jgi:hypothetical protein